ncbi:unnamed protein product [Cyprideis torosa]|uniref:DUF5745 domain-containing protein n=1 Tax=Cyprideis torosa TaxID=163714 RepID=A0A7R8ZT09_9CRUS|nr:unnamed protein product [Cyprideis torosa]CAG0896877.1 unnamed protein product [Cyprideis torosa]
MDYNTTFVANTENHAPWIPMTKSRPPLMGAMVPLPQAAAARRSRENEFTLLQSILYILEQDILGLELPHITAINLLNKEPADVYHLMELFEEIAAAFSLDTCGSPTSDDLVHNIAALNISSTSKRHSTSDDRTQEANCGKATEKKVLQYLDSQVTALELLKNQVSSWQRQQDQLLHKAAIQRAKGARRDRKISDLRIKRYVDEYLVGHERRLQAADLTAVTKGTAVLDTSGKELVMKNYLRDVTEVRRQEAVKELQRMRLRRRLEAETAQFQADAEQARQGFRSRAEHLHDDYGDSVERFPMPPVG